MKTGEQRHDSWQHIGRAAEQFARSVARDAADFASRVEQHVGALASEIGREWRGAGEGTAKAKINPADDVRRVFEDVRGVLSTVVERVDELITSAFAPGAASDDTWTRVTANHDGVCAGCGRPIAAGADAFARRKAGSHELRCAGCGIPKPSA
jgi:hypothetical protein